MWSQKNPSTAFRTFPSHAVFFMQFKVLTARKLPRGARQSYWCAAFWIACLLKPKILSANACNKGSHKMRLKRRASLRNSWLPLICWLTHGYSPRVLWAKTRSSSNKSWSLLYVSCLAFQVIGKTLIRRMQLAIIQQQGMETLAKTQGYPWISSLNKSKG